MNDLTGGFDAVVQVRVPIVEGLLAGLHRNGGHAERSPHLLHSFTAEVGSVDLPAEPVEMVSWSRSFDFADGGFQARADSLEVLPPGVLEAVEEAERELRRVRNEGVRGRAQVQVSTPRVSFPDGSTSKVTATFQVRARFLPDAGSAPFPERVHGELRATFLLAVTTAQGGGTLLELTPSDDDGEIVFAPAKGSGTSPDAAEQVAVEIRYALRNRFGAMTLELGGDFPFSGFKSLGGGTDAVVALPVTLAGSPPPSGPAGVDTAFLAFSDHFGIAVARELLDAQLQPMLDGLEEAELEFSLQFVISWATYTVSLSSAELDWQNGELELTVEGSAVTGSIFPNYDFTVVQRLTLVLDPATQEITLVALGDPTITGLPGFAVDTARGAIVEARDAAIADAQSQVDDALGQVSLADAMEGLDGAPATRYTSIEITPEGVVLHGAVEESLLPGAVVHFVESGDGSEFNALGTWAPGGWIERYLWSWKEAGFAQNPWGGVTHTWTDEHGFVLPAPAGDQNVLSVCLYVEGSRTRRDGSVEQVLAGDVCRVSAPSWIVATMPPWWDLFLPIWEIEMGPDDGLEEGMQGHVNGLANAVPRTTLGANSVVHFAGDESARPLEALGRALDGLGSRPEVPMAVYLVLPRGALADRRSAVEERLGTLRRDLGVHLAVTEDYEGSWSRAFGWEKGAATFVMNARGEFVGRQAGPPEGSFLAELERRLLPGRPLRHRQLRLAVPEGECPPDVGFRYLDGRRSGLRRLRGKPVLLSFWKSWSAPCLRELQRLQRVCDQVGPEAPTVVAVNGGEDAAVVERTAAELGLTVSVAVDPGRRIARRFGIQCWPTNVSIGEDGRVRTAHFGVGRSRAPRSGEEARD